MRVPRRARPPASARDERAEVKSEERRARRGAGGLRARATSHHVCLSRVSFSCFFTSLFVLAFSPEALTKLARSRKDIIIAQLRLQLLTASVAGGGAMGYGYQWAKSSELVSVPFPLPRAACMVATVASGNIAASISFDWKMLQCEWPTPGTATNRCVSGRSLQALHSPDAATSAYTCLTCW